MCLITCIFCSNLELLIPCWSLTSAMWQWVTESEVPTVYRTVILQKSHSMHPTTLYHIPEDPNLYQSSRWLTSVFHSEITCVTYDWKENNQISNVLWYSSFGKIQPLQDNNFCPKIPEFWKFHTSAISNSSTYSTQKATHISTAMIPKNTTFSCKLVQGGMWAVLTWHEMSPRENNFVN